MDALNQLYLNVYEHPRDDGARRVLADALLEAGDVRGELIMLQYATHAVARKRAKKLIERHRRHFLGPLCDVVLPGSDDWERGFLVSCIARLDGRTTDCPAWATVQRLGVIGRGRHDPDEVGSRWMRSLREVTVLPESEGWYHRQHELKLMRERMVRLLSGANRLRLLKS